MAETDMEVVLDESVEEAVPNKRRRKIIFVPLLLLVFIAVAFITFLNSEVFDILNLDVIGNRYLAANEITLLAAVPKDQNIFTAPLRKMEKVLSKIPKVESVSIKRRLPNALEIHIEEKATIAYVAYAGYYVEVDRKGNAIAVAEILTDMNAPIISNVDITYLSIGDIVEPNKVISTATYIGELLAKNGVSNLSEISMGELDLSGKPKDISLYTSDGIKVLLGTFNGVEERIELLAPLLASLREGSRKPVRIDLRVASKPVVAY